MNEWWKFDGPEDTEARDVQLDIAERAALEAIRTITTWAKAHPERVLVASGTLRKISTAAGAQAQSLGLRSVTVKRGER